MIQGSVALFFLLGGVGCGECAGCMIVLVLGSNESFFLSTNQNENKRNNSTKITWP